VPELEIVVPELEIVVPELVITTSQAVWEQAFSVAGLPPRPKHRSSGTGCVPPFTEQ